MNIRRRKLLAILAGLAPLHFVPAAAFTRAARGTGGRPISFSVRRLGEAYLRERPDEADRTLLLKELGPGLENIAGISDLTKRFRARIGEDFAAGRTIILDGWMLSETECRLCALQLLT